MSFDGGGGTIYNIMTLILLYMLRDEITTVNTIETILYDHKEVFKYSVTYSGAGGN